MATPPQRATAAVALLAVIEHGRTFREQTVSVSQYLVVCRRLLAEHGPRLQRRGARARVAVASVRARAPRSAAGGRVGRRAGGRRRQWTHGPVARAVFGSALAFVGWRFKVGKGKALAARRDRLPVRYRFQLSRPFHLERSARAEQQQAAGGRSGRRQLGGSTGHMQVGSSAFSPLALAAAGLHRWVQRDHQVFIQGTSATQWCVSPSRGAIITLGP